MQITIETAEIQTRMSKAGKPYDVQVAYAHMVDRDGKAKRYPEEINIFPRRNDSGQSIPYKPGEYRLADTGFQVERGFLDLQFVNLVPISGK